jgi:plasmid replication initiation protein
MAATPYEILTFVGRGTSARDYARLKAALDRLQSTSILTSIRQPTERRSHRFSWINERKETADPQGRPLGLELILPDWFYTGVLNRSLVLTIDPAYFNLTGGLERWLYRLVVANGCQVIGFSSSADCTGPSASTSRPFLSMRWRLRSAGAVSQPRLGKTCEFFRAIGDRNPPAIGDPIPVLPGTEIARNLSQLNSLPRP